MTGQYAQTGVIGGGASGCTPTKRQGFGLTHHRGGSPFSGVARLYPGAAGLKGDAVAGLYFEQFRIGQTFTHEVRRTVTDMDNMLFSSLTYNPAAIHIDHAYCATTEFGKPLMNSIFTLGLVIGLSVQDTTFGTTVANLGMTDTTFPKPVLAGDTIRSETTVRNLRPSKSRPGQGIVTFEHVGLNQHDEIVCRTIRAALMLAQPSSVSA